jgi:hypothetical protein
MPARCCGTPPAFPRRHTSLARTHRRWWSRRRAACADFDRSMNGPVCKAPVRSAGSIVAIRLESAGSSGPAGRLGPERSRGDSRRLQAAPGSGALGRLATGRASSVAERFAYVGDAHGPKARATAAGVRIPLVNGVQSFHWTTGDVAHDHRGRPGLDSGAPRGGVCSRYGRSGVGTCCVTSASQFWRTPTKMGSIPWNIGDSR